MYKIILQTIYSICDFDYFFQFINICNQSGRESAQQVKVQICPGTDWNTIETESNKINLG